MQKSQIFGVKLLIISLVLFVILIVDAIMLSQLLNLHNSVSVLQVQIGGSCVVASGILASISLLQLKKISTVRASSYVIMALIFIAFPFIYATTPYSLTSFFNLF